MRQSKRFFLLTSALFGAVLFAGAAHAQGSVAIDTDDIGGVVTGPQGPEAGVWVIAETNDLPTRYAKMVLTDDQDATSYPTYRRVSIRSGFAVTVSWIRP